MSVEEKKATALKFIDAINRQDVALLREVSTPEVAKVWEESLGWLYSTMKDHHIDVSGLVADEEGVAIKLATCGYHTGELFGLPATGKWWTNRGSVFFAFRDGKVAQVDALFDVENHIKQIGGAIQPTGT